MQYVPRQYQPPMTNFALDNERCNIWARMGAGKGASTLDAISQLLMFNEVRRVLVLGPRLVAKHTWPDEVRQFNESFGHMSIAAAVGTPAQRLAAVKSNPQILTANYDVVEWLTNGYGDRWPFDMVVADEAGRLSGHRVGQRTSVKGNEFFVSGGSVRAAALAKIAHKHVRRWVGLNGSPAPNGVVPVWAQMWFVDGGQRLGRSFSGFTDRYFRSFTTESGYSKLEPLPYAQKEIEDAIRDVCLTVDPRPFLNTRALVEHNVYVHLPPKARRHYDEVQKDLFTMIREGRFVEAFNEGGKVNKALQLGSWGAYTNTETREYEITHTEKLQALESIVSEAAGESLLIRYCFTPERDMILKAFPMFKPITAPNAMQDFQEGRLQGLVVHAASAGHGISLQKNCRILVDFASNYNFGEDEQIIERIGPTRQAQSGFDRDVYRYRIIAKDTIEETAVLPALTHKMGIQESLLAAMQR